MPVSSKRVAGKVTPISHTIHWGPYTPPEDVSVSGGLRSSSTPRGLIFMHGTGGHALSWLGTDERRLWGQVLELAGGRYRIIAPRAGDIATGAASYGNNNAMTAVSNCVAWAQAQGLIAAGKVALAGHSMGLVTAINWAFRNATSVAGMCIIDGGCFLSKWYDDGIPGYQTAGQVQSALNAAYGGNWLADEANRCPKLIADQSSAVRAIPMRYWLAGDGSAGDGIKVIPEADAATFAASYGANCVTSQPNATADHGTVHRFIPPQDVVTFLDGLTWS